MLTLQEKIDIVSERYDPDMVVDILELTSRQLVTSFPDELEAKWDLFDETEGDIVYGYVDADN